MVKHTVVFAAVVAFVAVGFLAGILLEQGDDSLMSQASYDSLSDSLDNAFADYCKSIEGDESFDCEPCNSLNSYSQPITFSCSGGGTGTIAGGLWELVARGYWTGGANALADEACGGSAGNAVGTSCPVEAFTAAAFMTIQNAVSNGDAVATSAWNYESAEAFCAVIEGSGLTDTLSNQFCAFDGSEAFTVSCENGASWTGTGADLFAGGIHSVDEFFTNGICAGSAVSGRMRRLSESSEADLRSRLVKRDDTSRALWGSPPPPSGGSLGNCCGNSCFGRCGDGCSCWSWVCGDCNNHQGCQEHDYYCSCVGMWHYRCVTFLAGPSTCNWPGCASSKCARRNGCWTP